LPTPPPIACAALVTRLTNLMQLAGIAKHLWNLQDLVDDLDRRR
jgi:hypothetical protein